MSNSSWMKMFVSVLMSVAIALPSSVWANIPNSQYMSESSTASRPEGIPVVLLPQPTPDGEVAYLAVAPIEKGKQEDEVICSTAKASKDRKRAMVLSVEGKNSRALQTALACGNAEWINSFQVGRPDESPILNTKTLSTAAKKKFLQSMAGMAEFLKDNKWGLLVSVYVASVNGGYSWYQASNIHPGLMVAGVLFAWTALQSMFSHHWDRFLDGIGDGAIWTFTAVASMFGKKIEPSNSTRLARNFVIFGTVVLANTALLAYVFKQAGGYESAWATLLYGYAVATDIFDKNVARGGARGLFNKAVLKWFPIIRILVASLFEVASYLHVDNIQLALAILTTIGLTWLMMDGTTEDKLIQGAKMTTVRVKNWFKRAGRAIASFPRKVGERVSMAFQEKPRELETCEESLGAPNRKSLSDFYQTNIITAGAPPWSP